MADEFPLLFDLGLYVKDIRGDGNCLFSSLSDQIRGSQEHHAELRDRVIAYMRAHADYYKAFLDVQPGGGTRRNPKRKNAGAYSTPASFKPPTAEEIDRAFEQHVERMAKGGTWGDNLEIVAFAAAFNVDVRIYLSDFTYMVPGQGDEATRGIAHIAYHADWEHYSSIRNIDGPHEGLPNVQWKKIDSEQESRLNQRAASHAQNQSYIEPYKIKIVQSSLPFLADQQTIKHALERMKGNVNNAVSMLIDQDEVGSISSTQESSSVERDYDSDDDQIWGPNKRANRSRIQRAAKNLMKDSQQRRVEMAARLAQHDGSQESVSLGVADLEIPDSKEGSPAPLDDDEWVPSGNETPETLASKGPTRLKINLNAKVGKTQVRGQGPRPRGHITARDRVTAKKRQQKEDRKRRALQEGSRDQENRLNVAKNQQQLSSTPPVEGPMRTLYI